MNGLNGGFPNYYNPNQEKNPQILIENHTEFSESLQGDINSLMDSTKNEKEIEAMIGRISFHGDDLSNPSDEDGHYDYMHQGEQFYDRESK